MKRILGLSGKSNLYPYITKDIENIYSWSRSALICWIETFEEYGGKFTPRSVENLLHDLYGEYTYAKSPELKKVLKELEKIKKLLSPLKKEMRKEVKIIISFFLFFY